MRAQLIAVALALVVVTAPVCLAQGWDAGDMLWDARSVEETRTQSWFGGTGMIVIPTAYVLEHKELNAHVHTLKVDATDSWEMVWGATTSIYPGFEIGVTGLDAAFTGTGSSELVYHVKYGGNLDKLLKLGEGAPDIAIGLRDFTDRVDDIFYVVLSKDFEVDETPGNTIGLSLGFGNASSGAPLDGVFMGVDFTPFDFARMQVEYDSENINTSLRYWWSEWAVTEIGVLDGQFGGGVTLHTGW